MVNQQPIINSAIVQCSPSLALIKYWGKTDSIRNLPATPSLALTLSELTTETRAYAIDHAQANDVVIIDQVMQESSRFAPCLTALRRWLKTDRRFWIESTNNFPTASGLASSASGLAALVLSACLSTGAEPNWQALSGIARIGSASAARSLYGGFTWLDRNAESACVLHAADFWPDLRVVIVRVQDQAKPITSRQAMESTKTNSPYFDAWVENAPALAAQARSALDRRDLDALGSQIRLSYLRMFGTMLAADPPILYWLPDSLAIIRLCATMRQQGLAAWETMDAGPQVKIICLTEHVNQIYATIQQQLPQLSLLIDRPGPGPRILNKPQLLGEPHRLIQQMATKLDLDLR
jgi:diphosphomevalonate decarboxylase